jgi:hypothetical protein
VFPLAANVETIKRCLDEQINQGYYQPSVQWEHLPMGVVAGQVVRAAVLEKKEALAKGIKQKCDLEVYFGVELTDDVLADYDAGKINFGSPEIRGSLVNIPYADEHGREWEFLIGELSIVGSPHNITQTPAKKLHGVKMSAGGSMEPDQMAAELQALKDEQAAQREMLAKMLAAVEKLAGVAIEEADDDVEMMNDAEDAAKMGAAAATEDKPVSMSAKAIQKLVDTAVTKAVKMSNQQTLAERDVDALIAEREVPTDVTRKDLLAVRMSSPAAFVAIRSNFPAKTGTQPGPGGFRDRSAVGGTSKPGAGTGKVQMGSDAHAALHLSRAAELAEAAGEKGKINKHMIAARIAVDSELRESGRLTK